MDENKHTTGFLRHRLGGYREYAAPPPLAGFSEAVWIYRTPPRTTQPGGASHRVLPELTLSLAFCRQRRYGDRSGDSSLLLIGPRTKPCVSSFAPGYEMAAVRVRFLHAVIAADRAVDPGWARLAADAGFCDQSHLVRESRALCGLSPGEVHRERRAEAEMSNPDDA